MNFVDEFALAYFVVLETIGHLEILLRGCMVVTNCNASCYWLQVITL